MTARYKPYPEYKPSGVEWLGEVPEHWNIFTGKRIFRQRITRAFADDKQLAATQQFGVIPQDMYMKENSQKVVLALKGTDSFRHVEVNDYVISLRSFQGGIEHSEYSGCVSPAYTVLAPAKPVHEGYYKYLFKSAPYICALQASTDSLREGKSITYEQFGKICVPTLAVNEQRAIATFLDRETGKIDRMIGKQERMIELLKEKRQAVISHAVTKGLDPNVPMKDSGVEWLGEIPEHWTVKSIKAVAQVGNGSTPNRENTLYWESGTYPWLNSSVVNQEQVTSSEQFVTELALSECHLPKLKPPIILIGITGQGRTRGLATTLLCEATINQHVAYVKVRSKLVSINYLRRAFDMAYTFLRFDSEGGGSTKGAITCDQIKTMKVPVAPIEEQQAIAEHLDEATTKIDHLIAKAEQAIELIKERRAALISAAVTGKIDVRDVGGGNRGGKNAARTEQPPKRPERVM